MHTEKNTSNSTKVYGQRDSTVFHLLIFLLLVVPFYLNDFANIFINDWRLWLLIDYIGLKLFPIMIILWLVLSSRMQVGELGIRKQGIGPFIALFVAVAFVGTFIDQNGYQVIEDLPGYSPLGGMPPIDNASWDWFDLTVGLFLVGVVEELVFRGYMLNLLQRFTNNTVVIVVLSAIVFGLIHWSLGFHSVLVTAIIGAVFMFAYIKTKALLPIMLAHFAVNFIDFAGVIPKSIFKII